MQFLVSALLANCYTALYGSLAGQYFDVQGVAAPTLEEYLQF